MRVRSYAIVTAGYWAFTVTDGALRMLVLLHFHELGYSPVAIAFLFLAYELMGIVTNLVGGWAGARTGLNRTLVAGLALQAVVLGLLAAWRPGSAQWTAVVFVMGLQALSGVAKDLTKMSSKSAVKLVAGDGALFRLVAVLTGSKNALKGVGFFVGAALLARLGWSGALLVLAGLVVAALVAVLVLLDEDIGRSSSKPTLRSALSTSGAVNRLSTARFFLFGARDIWFVVALPVFLDESLGWSYEGIGAFLAVWVIGYGFVQTVAPRLLRGVLGAGGSLTGEPRGEVGAARLWALLLAGVSAAIAVGVAVGDETVTTAAVVGGLILFGLVFAVNSSLHSYLILAYSERDDVSLDVGFYYSANAVGRLVGTLLSGVLYLAGGLPVALWGSTVFVALTWLLSLRLPPVPPQGDTESAVATA
ncbi:MAG: organoarsenical effux MFS transporter ArsJ [Actinomycetota bacterium]